MRKCTICGKTIKNKRAKVCCSHKCRNILLGKEGKKFGENNNIYLDKKIQNKVIKKYKQFKNAPETAKYFDYNIKTIFRILQKRKVKIYQNTIDLDEKYFKNISCWQKAYALGWYFSDGYITKTKDGYFRCGINLNTKDIEILKFIKKQISYKGKIYNYIKYRKGTKTFISTLTSGCYEFVKNLRYQGVHERKSDYLLPPKHIPNKYLNSFILGFYEGDGTYKYKNGNHLSIVGTVDMCNWICKVLKRNNMYSKVRKKHKKLYSVNIERTNDIIRFYNYVYKDCTFSLKRKEKEFLNIINLVKTGKVKPRFK
jgi:hypothetical protein